jgi:GT2 family glycosyltransferase
MGMDDSPLNQNSANADWIRRFERSLAESRSGFEETAERLRELEKALDEIKNSAFWRLHQKLARVGAVIAPRGSLRREALRLSYRGLRALPRMRDRRWTANKLRLGLNRATTMFGLLLRPCQVVGNRLMAPLWRKRLMPTPPSLFPIPARVDVSIIVPVFNHGMDTLSCLESIARTTSGGSYEVIVVDDGSTDETAELLKCVAGLITIRSEQTAGFLGSCNRGAAAARGDYLVFLNNQTMVTPGWLEALVATFQDIPGTGLVGAKLVSPDGRLREAGGMIWRDASGWKYGQHDDPDHPRFNFAREVDYCPGACVMVPRSLFVQCGGFDSHYAPASYEDVDLAFKIRQAGFKVIYQPLATIVHHEGWTSGRSTGTGEGSSQPVNQSKFQERWRDHLAAHPMPCQSPFRVVHPHGVETESRGQVLLIDHRMLTPDRDAGSVRMLEMIRAIRRSGHHVCFIPDNLLAQAPYKQQLQGIGVEVIHHPYCRSIAAFLKQHGHEFDLVIISRAEIAARHMSTVRRHAPQAKVIFDTVDLHFLREKREAELKQDPSLRPAVARTKQQELRLVRRADLTLVVSPVEAEILEKECPWHDVHVFPTIYPVGQADDHRFDGRRNIVFIGSFEHPPNADGVLYFASEILPKVLQRIPDAVFQVIGSGPPPEIQRLASRHLEVLGHVPEVTSYFDRARLSVAPLRFGAGVKGKVNQSLALGVPTVVTSVAAEGMYLVHEENAMIADDPESFAEAIVRVWTSPELWKRLSASGRTNAQEHFSVEAAARHVDELLAWAGLSSQRRMDRSSAPGRAGRQEARGRRTPASVPAVPRPINRVQGGH